MIALALCAGLAAADAPEEEQALETYASQRLSVVERDVTTVYAAAYDGSGRFWFVAQGERRLLPTVEFAELVGDTEAARRVRRRQVGSIFAGSSLAVLGAGAGVLGLAGLATSTFNGTDGLPVMVGLSTVSVAGLVSGPLLIGRGVRARHPSALYTADEARRRAEAYNAELLDSLLDE